MENRLKALIAVGASVAVNCQPCLTYHIDRAKESGADEEEVSNAIEVAKAVRSGAAKSMDTFAQSAVNKSQGEKQSSGCGCSC
jgi:AhpD family alkylhydroperoxidase